MKITLLFTGKTKAAYLQEGVEEYLKRIKRYVPLDIIVISDVRASKKTGAGEVRQREGAQILKRVKPGDQVILLDEKGKKFSSVQFAKYLAGMEGKTAHTVFIIGGAYGFSDEVYSRANGQVSLSSMTFSHQMVRLIFAEQLYRAYSILNGEPYHHN